MPILQRITAAPADILKAVRLQALQDSPTAFGSTYADESQLSDADWRRRTQAWDHYHAISYVALDEDLPCGLIRAYLDELNPQCAHVASMWVAPTHRRAGIGSQLVIAIQTWAATRQVRELRLMVTNINQEAIDFYDHHGFSITGRMEPYPNDPALFEYEMVKSLDRS